jgi:hypothetical protein
MSFLSAPLKFHTTSVLAQMDAVSDLQGLVKQLTLERNSARDLYDKVWRDNCNYLANAQPLKWAALICTTSAHINTITLSGRQRADSTSFRAALAAATVGKRGLGP